METPRVRAAAAWWTAVGIWLCGCWRAEGASVPLTLSSSPRAPFAVSGGMPFPRGVLASLDQLRLEDAAGRELPAQFKSLALWPDGSHKSVLVIALLPASPATPYTLHYGPGVARAAAVSPLSVREDAASVIIDTGSIRLQVSKARFALFDQVWVDADGDGLFGSDEQLLAGPGELFLVNAADGVEYAASRYASPVVVIEESGPVRAVLKVSGKLQSSGGKTLTDFLVRISAVAGQSAVRVDYTLVDPRTEADVNAARSQLALAVSGYGLRLPVALISPEFLFGGEAAAHAGTVTGEHYLYQRGAMSYVDGTLKPFSFAYEGAGAGQKAPGWMELSDGRLGASVSVRHFWQQFPKELAIKDGQVIVSLHPMRASLPSPDVKYPALDGTTKAYRRPNTFYFPREGGAKTYQMLFDFHAGRRSEAELSALNATFQAMPRLLAPADWYAQSRVFGNLLPAGPLTAGYDQYLIDGILVPSVESKKAAGGLAVLYGWRDFGDRLRAGWVDVWNTVRIPGFYNDTHVGAHNFFIQYVRTLDERWWDLGEIASRHWMDIDVAHCPRYGYWKKGTAYVSFGPGEGHMIKHEVVDHDDRNLHWGHAHLSGLPDYYLLTGDPRALDVLKEVGNWWVNAAPVFFPTTASNPHWAEAERDYAWPLFVMNEAYRATGDVRYLQAAAQVVKHLLSWWQTPSDHWVGGVNVGRNDFRLGSGWWYMYPAQDNSPWPSAGTILYNGTNPWMAGALISAVDRFHELNQDYGYVEPASVREMLLQTMNYVVKFGWEDSRLYQSYDYFIYSEANRSTDGGKNHLLGPLASLYSVVQQGGLANPAWYDTAPTWLTIASKAYADWQVVKYRGTTSQGFYGYEMIHPMDFFAVMKALTTAPAPPPPLNSPPILAPIGARTIAEGQPLGFAISATDPDGDALTYAAGPLPGGASFSTASRVFAWTPTFSQAGSYLVTFSAADPAGLTDAESVTISVTPVNRAPVVDPVPAQTVNEGQFLSVIVTATDPDGDALSYAAGPLPAGAAFDPAARRFSWTPDSSQAGAYAVSLTVTDGQLGANASLAITVLDVSANAAPALSPIGARTIAEGQPLSFSVAATDPDGDTLAYAAAPLPAGAVFDPLSRLFSWTPTFEQAGEYAVVFSVSDPAGLSDAEPVTIAVTPVNRAPVVDPVPAQTVSEGQPLSVIVSATDSDGDALSYAAGPLPAGAAFDPAARRFSWTPDSGQAGNYSVAITASDGQLQSAASISITVIDVTGNRPPVLAAISNQTVAEGATLRVTVSASDPDGDALSFSASGLPPGAVFDTGTRTLTWTPSAIQAGGYSVRFQVSDGAESDDQSSSITVQEAILVLGGRILTASDAPAAGVQVEATVASKTYGRATTGADGRYQILGLSASVWYNIRASGPPTTPSSKKVMLSGGDLLSVDFGQKR